jgi:GT2 family glycosyltransferase
VDGKFFRVGGVKFHVKGVSYGPFSPNSAGQCFSSPERARADFALFRELGANVVRVYHVPPRWFLELASEHALRVFVDVPWNQHLCFLESAHQKSQAVDAVRRAIFACARHPAIFAFSLANEIPADIVRWCGSRQTSEFIDELVAEAKKVDPDCLCTATSFPSTEFLRPKALDFICYNIYLHKRVLFRNYLARLQMSAEAKPLLLGEFGADSIREGEGAKAHMLEWQIESAFREGLAGAIVFSFTDDWYRGGRQVDDWQMGITTREREPKPSFAVVRKQFQLAPYFPLPRHPKVSVVVAAYNAERTLKACLESLQRLRYPNYEIILVDDGSWDSTREIAASFTSIRIVRHPQNLGLSAARNSGIYASTGEIIAFTDADCRADEDWLYYLVGTLLEGGYAGVGGPNLLPPEDSPVAAAVMASPGGPAHVMLTDRQAEHIPGCNMAFFRSALEEIGYFDPVYWKAGDDVDLCWRLQQEGHRLGFSPSAFVWHYRRSTVRDYLAQQSGYGEAEAMLVRKHPEYFNSLGGSMWRGRIYSTSRLGRLLRPQMIYRGLFGSAGFQSLYASGPDFPLLLCTSLEYHLVITLPLWVLSATVRPLLPLAITSLLLSVGVCAASGWRAELPRGRILWWSRPLVTLLFFLQPIVRGAARYRERISHRPAENAARDSLDSISLRRGGSSLKELQYWAQQRMARVDWVSKIAQKLDSSSWPFKSDAGWGDFDLELLGSRWSTVQLTTMAEEYPGGKQMLRCRLRSRWSLQAIAAFWIICGLELLLLGLIAKWTHWWCWIAFLTTLPLFAVFVRWAQRKQRSVLIVLLDELGGSIGLTKVGAVEIAPAAESQSESLAAVKN